MERLVCSIPPYSFPPYPARQIAAGSVKIQAGDRVSSLRQLGEPLLTPVVPAHRLRVAPAGLHVVDRRRLHRLMAQRPISCARRSRCTSASPSNNGLDRAPLRYRCADNSHVNPIPPWIGSSGGGAREWTPGPWRSWRSGSLVSQPRTRPTCRLAAPRNHFLVLTEVIAVVGGMDLGGEQGDAFGGVGVAVDAWQPANGALDVGRRFRFPRRFGRRRACTSSLSMIVTVPSYQRRPP
ncbi:hypothetical protein MYSE111917_05560 [Mycobacterium senriense]